MSEASVRRDSDPLGPLLRFENVGLRYGLGPEVLQDVTFDLEPGGFRFLMGPSGAGKTSLMRLMYLGQRPSRGYMRLFGRDVNTLPRRDRPPLRRRIGVVFQDYALLDHMTVFDNVALPLRVAKAPESEARRHVTELLAWVGLADHMQARPPTLSGGQKQRCAIARAVIGRPDLLLADEPTGNVDERMAVRLLRLFEELNKLGTTVVIATHSDFLAARHQHPRLLLDAGRVAELPPLVPAGEGA